MTTDNNAEKVIGTIYKVARVDDISEQGIPKVLNFEVPIVGSDEKEQVLLTKEAALEFADKLAKDKMVSYAVFQCISIRTAKKIIDDTTPVEISPPSPIQGGDNVVPISELKKEA